MNKKSIWLIIGLMSAALIGSILLQLYWINWSVQLNRDHFNNNVTRALNSIADNLERMEEEDYLKELPQEVYNEFSVLQGQQAITYQLRNQAQSNRGITKEDIYEQLHQEECDCPVCKEERRIKYKSYELKEALRVANLVSLEERLPDIHIFNDLLKQEFKEKGVYLNFNYGVYSNKKASFILKDGHFLINDFGSPAITLDDDQLSNSRYKAKLFSKGISSPGYLAVYFPNLTSTIWRSAWKTILAALIFTGIILFCFIYTINVIFFQKKLGEMKTDFINNMTHEFKTPIATISLAADSITSPMISGNKDKVNRFAEIIKQENKRMLSQVEKVLQMAQLDKENFKLNITDIDLHELINQAVRHTNLQVEKKGGLVSSKLDAQKTIIQGDRTHISNIIHNLLDNANKYSPDEPQITVSTKNFPNGIEMTVRDNGIGMSKDALKHIFDKFFRVHTGNLHDVKGFGLGLSYVKAMVDAHKGSIDVKSELDKGSSFIIFLPFKHKV